MDKAQIGFELWHELRFSYWYMFQDSRMTVLKISEKVILLFAQ
jgi:hypothetical protein